jgi:molybdopterin converting factor small subunit
MSVRVRIPTPLRPHAGGQAALSLPGDTVDAVLAALIETAPGLRTHLLAEDGSLRSFINVYLNGEDVRARSGLATRLSDGDELAIVPAIAGGGACFDRRFSVTRR